jgi:aspartyl-tRNA synthetase
MLRDRTCGELTARDVGARVTLAGWVHRRRDHGSLIFLDLRDRYGITQCVVNATENEAAHQVASDVRNEYVLQVQGTVRARPAGTVNLRRERSKDLIRLRHEVVDFIRNFMVERGFWEIETTDLIRSDPTGARDLIVPSRYFPGKFWALPQSPQQLKQILMVGGVDRYFQIARCFRDEDPRADRTLEHSQLDIEMSFVEPKDVMALAEELYTKVFQQFARKPLKHVPWPRLTYEETMRRYGSDRPDLRFQMELFDLTDVFRASGFAVFRDTIARGGVVRGLRVPGKASATRKEIDDWTALAKRKGAKGLAQFAFAGSEVRSQVAKFLTAGELTALRETTHAADGDMVLAVADAYLVASESLGVLREHFGEALGLADRTSHVALWVHEFPLVQRTPSGGWTFAHNPFCAPLTPHDLELLDTAPQDAKSKQYDLVVDGRELGGGSVRVHQRSVQERIFAQMGISKEEAAERFGALLDALEYGAPPHGGIAPGIDRLVMTLAGTENIREVQAFPKTQTGYDPLLDAPAPVDPELLGELGIRVVPPPEKR